MSWVILTITVLFEVGWAIGLKYTNGFTRLWPTVGTVTAMVISLALLGIAMKDLPVGTAYAVWTGIGTVGTVLLGIFVRRLCRSRQVDLRWTDSRWHHRLKSIFPLRRFGLVHARC